jgi:hypothetical protein
MFPFLAVLICTMGALILLLVIISHEAAAQAEREAIKAQMERKPNLVEQREDSAWRADILKTSLRKTREKLSELRSRLGYVESDTSRLRNEVIDLAKTLQKLEQEDPTPENSKQLQEKLAHLQAKIAMARQKVNEQMKKMTGKDKSYAVVPYHGPNETRRHPIYVECRADGVFLQPEGVRLQESDFVGFFGPDNPLAAALRAKAAYLQQKYQFSDRLGRPYPLLLVRQTGIESYCAAMDAMRSWDSEFGYEFVEDDMKLDFNEPDMRLKQVVLREIEFARSKRQALAQAVPRLYNDPNFARSGNGGQQYYTVSPSKGGIVPYRGKVEDLKPVRPRRPVSGYPQYPNTNPGANVRPNVPPNGGVASNVPAYPGSYNGGNRVTAPQPTVNHGMTGTGNGMTETGNGMTGSASTTARNTLSGLGGSGYGVMGANGQGATAPLQNPGTMGSGNVPGTSGAPGMSGTQPSVPQMLNPLTGSGGGGATDSQEVPRLLQPPGVGAGGYPHTQGNSPGRPNSGNTYGNATISSSDAPIRQPPGIRGGLQGSGASRGTPSGQGASQGSAGGPGSPPAPMPEIKGEWPSHFSPVSTNSGSLSGGCNNPTCNNGSIPLPLAVGNPGTTDSPMLNRTSQAPLMNPWQASPSNPGSSANSANLQQSGSANSVNLQQPGSAMASLRHGSSSSKKGSIAEKRGKDWCLPEEAAYRVPLSRPISIECHGDRLVLRPTRHGVPGKMIPLKTQTRESVNELVSAVWDRVESWGTAGEEMYWRPILSVQVHPGGESRFADLQTLFEDSGFVVEQKKNGDVNRAASRRKR